MRRGPVLLLWVLAACQGKIGSPGASLDPSDPNHPNNPNNPNNPNDPMDPMDPMDPPFVFDAAESEARRLSQAELDQMINDVVGDTTRPAVRYLSEDEYAPYDNDYTLQSASMALIDALEVLASDVATRLAADPARRAAVLPCTPAGDGDEACLREIIEALGLRLYRRPLAAEEVDELAAFISFATETSPYYTSGFYTAVELVLRAMLQDPEVLYRVEIGTPSGDPNIKNLGPYEIASRLSFLIWGTIPDDALFADAAAARLATPDGRRAAAQRMLADPKARAWMHRFHAQWLGYRAIPHPQALVQAMDAETSALIDRVIFDQPSSYLDLFRSTETFVDDTLADHYGFDRPTGGRGWVPYPASEGRAGLLSHGSVLAAFSKFTDTSPTQRGILVRTRLMCLPILTPPPNVDVDQPPGNANQVCKEDRYRAHVEVQSCADCHNQMDPIGFGLERFDIGGRYRTNDDGLPQCAISGNGTLPGAGTFSGPAQLSQMLIDNGMLARCFVQQYTTYALGRRPTPPERRYIEQLSESFAAADHRFIDYLVSWTASDPFAKKKEPN